MKTSTWFLIAALAAAPIVTSASALAQDGAPREGAVRDGVRRHDGPRGHHGGGRHGGPGHRVEMLVAILGLDSHQEASVRQLFQANAPRREQIRQMTDETARRAAMRALHDQTRASIDALLTPDQRATLDRIEAVRREHGPRGRGHGHGRGPAPTAPASPVGI